MNKKLVLLIGPSGAGKTTLMEKTFDPAQILRSSTSRPMRPGEIDGQDYLFVSSETFQSMIENDELIQHVSYNGNFYGVSVKELQQTLDHFDTAVVAVVYPAISQYQTYAKRHPEVKVLPFFVSVSKPVLLEHFKTRRESPDKKAQRIALYDTEIINKRFFGEDRILDMDPDDFGQSARQKLLDQLYEYDEQELNDNQISR